MDFNMKTPALEWEEEYILRLSVTGDLCSDTWLMLRRHEFYTMET